MYVSDKDNVTPECTCLNCHKPLNRASAVAEDASPSDGDFTMCIGCGHLMIFNADQTLRNPTDEELAEIAGDERMITISNAIAKLHRQS